MAGVMKTFQTAKAKEMLPWTKDRTDAFVRFMGISELLGVLGLILPLVTGILPWLTVLAAFGLALIQILAISTEHLPRSGLKNQNMGRRSCQTTIYGGRTSAMIIFETACNKEYNALPVNLVLLALSVFVMYGRWGMFQ